MEKMDNQGTVEKILKKLLVNNNLLIKDCGKNVTYKYLMY